jgi:hypothetical protein
LVAKTIHHLLTPLSALVWGFDQIEKLVTQRVAEKLKKVPPEKLVEPPLSVVGPAFESLKYAGHDPTLREMYASLIASAINSDTTALTHPAFVDVIRQMTPLDAHLMTYLQADLALPLLSVRFTPGGNRHQEQPLIDDFTVISSLDPIPSTEAAQLSVDNLRRLRLAASPAGKALLDDGLYAALLDHPTIVALSNAAKSHGLVLYEKKLLQATTFGMVFARVCGVGSLPIEQGTTTQIDRPS